MVTIKQDIENKIRKAERYEKANPGISVYTDDEPKIYIQKEMVSSTAFRSLSRVAFIVYLDFLGKRVMRPAGTIRTDGRKKSKKKWACVNNGQLVYPYSEAVENGLSRTGFRNAIDELQGKGFIDITHLGQGGKKPAKGTGDYTLYKLDNRWRDFDITTGTATIPPKKPRKKDTRGNRGFQKYWAEKKQS